MGPSPTQGWKSIVKK